MNMPIREQAEGFLAECCRSIPVWDSRRQLDYGFEVWIPRVVEAYYRAAGKTQPDLMYSPDAEPICRVFYEAAWEFSRRGILRPSLLSPRGMGSHSPPAGDGYSLTTAGREWLQLSKTGWYPTDPSRYIAALAKASKFCGEAFAQRAQKAARCAQSANYLACCAMCGAAAESILLAMAVAKTQESDRVLRLYSGRDGRQKLLSVILADAESFLAHGVKPGFSVLTYWRDIAAHGRTASITDVEADSALLTLFRFAMFVADNWEALTTKVR